jgi:phenylalanyl-tRNA synthetase alpha chain
MVSLKLLKKQAEKELKDAQDLKDFDDIFKKYLGKQGELVKVLRSLKKLPKGKRIKIGKEANELKNFIRQRIELRTNEIRKSGAFTEKEEWIDITIPGKRPAVGHLHPLTQVQRKVEEIFQSIGFSVVEGPEIETEWYNFDALNIPKDHPARDMWNTFWLRQNLKPHTLKSKQEILKSKVFNQRLLLRAHTSPVQVRYMEKHRPPLRIIVPGRIFRHEATDATHEIQFYHVEGLMVDKNISVANFKAIIQEFFRRFFQKEIGVRLRPSYFPFTEPSFEIDINCVVCGGKGCSVCQKSGWLEMMGAGMVHPNVYKNSGLNPRDWQGFAFGIGMDRLAMMKYKIHDIRLFHSGDLRFLRQF